MLKLFGWIRSYYLYFYFVFSWDERRKRRDPWFGFCATVSSVMVWPASVVIGAVNKFWPFIDDLIREELFNFRGNVNYYVLLGIFVSCLLTYLVCRVGLTFEEIEARLKAIPFFSESSKLKASPLILANLLFCVVVMNIIYS